MNEKKLKIGFENALKVRKGKWSTRIFISILTFIEFIHLGPLSLLK